MYTLFVLFYYYIILHVTLPVAELCIFPAFELDHK